MVEERQEAPEFPKQVTEYGVKYIDPDENAKIRIRKVRCDGPDTARYLVKHHPAKPTLLTREVVLLTDWEEVSP